MATYREIKGLSIPYLDSDYPSSVAATQEGQVWYNSATGKLRSFLAFDTWATGAPMITAREGLGGAGLQTAAIGFGGGPPGVGVTEYYNGSGWSEVADLNTPGWGLAGCGTQTAALGFGRATGPNSQQVEKWDGSSWSEQPDMNTGRDYPAGVGTSTAALAIGGRNPSDAPTENVESWDGSSWTEGPDLNTERMGLAATGTTTAAIAFGGEESPITGKTETYDGSSWTEVSDLNQVRWALSNAGTQTAALAFSGDIPPHTAKTEIYDGSSWTETTDMSNSRRFLGGDGTLQAAIGFGGDAPGDVADTEEFNHAILTYTAAAWTSITNTPASGSNGFIGNCGTSTAGMFLTYGPPSQHTIEWDGSSWTAGGDYPSDRFGGAKGGTQTAAFAAGGSPPVTTEGNTYDGSSWTDAGTMSQGRNYFGGGGTQTAGIICGGWLGPPGRTDNTDEYDGSSWTAGGDLNNATWRNGIAGTSTAGMTMGLNNPSGNSNASLDAETYNGTAWTNSPGLLVAGIAEFGNVAGPSTNWLAYGCSPSSATSYLYDGTSTITAASINTARTTGQGFGISTSAILATGYAGGSPGLSNAGEEFSGETSAAEAVDVDFD